MQEKSIAIGAILAAFAASLCCLGPLLLGAAGVGAALAGTFAPLRPYFLALSAVLLVAGFYFVYRKPKAPTACEGQACAPDGPVRRIAKPLLWLAALTVAALALFPVYGSKLVGTGQAAVPVTAARLETAHLKISGMTCDVCASVIQRKLTETPGVAEAKVSFAGESATVKYDPAKAQPSQLAQAVDAVGYKASLAK